MGPGDEEELANGGEELAETEAEQAPEDTVPEDHEASDASDPEEDEVA
jgi:hypothetical protein